MRLGELCLKLRRDLKGSNLTTTKLRRWADKGIIKTTREKSSNHRLIMEDYLRIKAKVIFLLSGGDWHYADDLNIVEDHIARLKKYEISS